MAFHYTKLAQLTVAYSQIVLSPHLDDAVLSLGGMLAARAARGGSALVLNLGTGSPGAHTTFSPFAAALHARWGLDPAVVVKQRLVEDETALELLGVDSYQLDLLDAIYRMPTAYTDNATLFGAIAPDDPMPKLVLDQLRALVARQPQAVIYAPLGVGHHVDHQAAFAAARALLLEGVSVAFYEDVPYVLAEGALEARFAELGGIERFTPVLTPFDQVALSRKLAAIEAYASQIGTLFDDVQAMHDVITAHASQHTVAGQGFAERVWMAQ